MVASLLSAAVLMGSCALAIFLLSRTKDQYRLALRDARHAADLYGAARTSADQARQNADAERDAMRLAKQRYDLAAGLASDPVPGPWGLQLVPDPPAGENGDGALAVPLEALTPPPLPLGPSLYSCERCCAIAPPGGLTRSWMGTGTRRVCVNTGACGRRVRAREAADQ